MKEEQGCNDSGENPTEWLQLELSRSTFMCGLLPKRQLLPLLLTLHDLNVEVGERVAPAGSLASTPDRLQS